MTISASDRELRLTGIGGSDAAKVVGLSRWGGPMSLYLEKIGQTAPLVETERMKWGKILEEPVAREYAIQTGRRVRRMAAFLRHPEYEFLYANVDRESLQRGTPPRILEVKTAGTFAASEFGEPGSDQVPPDYLLQCQHYLMVTGRDICDLAVLIGGNKFVAYTIERDDELIGDLLTAEVRLWTENIVPRIPPDIDGSEASTEYLRSKYADSGETIGMTEPIELLAYDYRAAMEEIKAAEERKALVANQLRDLIGNAARAEGRGVRVTNATVQSPARTAWDEVVKEASVPAELIAKHTTRADPQRRLTVTIKDA